MDATVVTVGAQIVVDALRALESWSFDSFLKATVANDAMVNNLAVTDRSRSTAFLASTDVIATGTMRAMF